MIDHDVLTLLLEQLPVRSEQWCADSAGATHGFVHALCEERIMFAVGVPITADVRDAVLALPQTAWVHGRTQHGEVRSGAAVAELHGLDLSGRPPGTRGIARREPWHTGAQTSFLDAYGHRITVFITDQPDTAVGELERRHRRHAPGRGRIRRTLFTDGRQAVVRPADTVNVRAAADAISPLVTAG